MARGTNSGCDTALRPRGSARVARAGGAQGAPSDREATRPRGRPCGAPRVGSVIEGIETISRGSHCHIYTHHFPFFSLCGTMFPHGLTCAGRVAAQQALDPVGPDRKVSIAWTRVHAIVRSSTWGKSRLSGYDRMLTCGHVESSDASNLHQTDVVAIAIIITIFFHPMADAHRNHGPRDRAIVTIRSPEALSDGYEDTWKNSTIVVRSNRDRGPIEPRSWSLRYGITSIDQDDD